MKKEFKKIIEVAENLGWSVKVDKKDFIFSKFSPAGQDFNIEITAEDSSEVVNKVRERYEDFDVSYETYIWLDDTGHGANGAPYDMKDLYEDMQACEKMIDGLADALEEIEFEDEEE